MSRRRGAALCVLAVLLAFAVYANALDNPFIYDDHRVVVENTALANPSSLGAVVRRDVMRPATAASYALDARVWGRGPFGFHLTSVVLHAVNVALVALFAWRASDDLRRRGVPSLSHAVAPTTAAIFAVHPMMTQAVGYISGRSEVLCATFVVAGLLAARRWLLGGGARWAAAAVAAWVGAVASKEVGIVAPALVVAYDALILHGGWLPRQRLRRVYLPLVLAAVGLLIVRLAVFVAVEHRGEVDLAWTLALIELDVVRRYLAMLLVPANQSIFHAPAPLGLADARTFGALLVAAIVLGEIWLRRRHAPLASFGLLWFLVLLVPSSALVVLNRGEPMAEQRVYLAGVGVFLAVGVAAGQVWAFRPSGFMRTLGLLAGAALVLSLAGRTVLRNQLWSSPTMVWLEAAERAPGHWLPMLMLGEELHRTGRHADAVTAFQRAAAVNPDHAATQGDLGTCLLERGDIAGAEAAFTAQRRLEPQSVEASNGLATAAFARGDVDAARRGFAESLRLDPPNLVARRGLAVIAETVDDDPAEALRLCQEIAVLAPGATDDAECVSRNRARLESGGGAQR